MCGWGFVFKNFQSSPDRLTATIAGAERAFEIREAQLNTI